MVRYAMGNMKAASVIRGCAVDPRSSAGPQVGVSAPWRGASDALSGTS